MSDVKTSIRKMQDETKSANAFYAVQIAQLKAMLDDPAVPEADKVEMRAQLQKLVEKDKKAGA